MRVIRASFRKSLAILDDMFFSLQTFFFKQLKTVIVALLCISAPLVVADNNNNSSGSKRIEVYELSQNYWDIQYGDSLSKIAYYLLPNNPAKRVSLQKDIVSLNPHAFIAGDPARMIAGKKLQLPGYMKNAGPFLRR